MRRYTIRAGEREHFARYFETFSPEAFERRFLPLAERALPELVGTGRLRARPEMLVLAPTRRSRLRWLSQEEL